MGFWGLLKVASAPILQALIVSGVGAFMSTGYSNLLLADTRRNLNKIVFMVFTPSLIFASLSETVTLEDILSWWFMPINIGTTFLLGSVFGWILVKLVKPEKHLEGLLIACSSAGNLGNLMLVIVPAICEERNSPFGDRDVCAAAGVSYASFSMALGSLFIWTYTYQLVRSSSVEDGRVKVPNDDVEGDGKACLLEGGGPSWKKKVLGSIHEIAGELAAPPTVAAIAGLSFGAVSWMRNLVVGENAPLKVIQDSLKMLGSGTIPCITLVLGGNLSSRGWRTSKLNAAAVVGVVCIRCLVLPLLGIALVRAASLLRFLPPDPLYHYVLMIQFTVPPAMNIGTMTQLFDVAQEECSFLLMSTYLASIFSLTLWPTAYMWFLS